MSEGSPLSIKDLLDSIKARFGSEVIIDSDNSLKFSCGKIELKPNPYSAHYYYEYFDKIRFEIVPSPWDVRESFYFMYIMYNNKNVHITWMGSHLIPPYFRSIEEIVNKIENLLFYQNK